MGNIIKQTSDFDFNSSSYLATSSLLMAASKNIGNDKQFCSNFLYLSK